MTKQEANSKVRKLFNRWQRDFRATKKDFEDNWVEPTEEYYKELKQFKADCKALHNVVGVYTYLTDRNALKMASICSSVRFVEPYQMLMQLQKTTNSY